MKKALSVITRIYRMYSVNVAILLPLFGLTGIGLFVNHIPYLNLFAELVITAILVIDWFAILWLSRISTRTMFIVGLSLFFVTWVLQALRLDWYAEVLANLCYIIFITALFFEMLRGFSFSKT